MGKEGGNIGGRKTDLAGRIQFAGRRQGVYRNQVRHLFLNPLSKNLFPNSAYVIVPRI